MNLQTLMSPRADEQPHLNSNRDLYFATRAIKRGPRVHPLPPAQRPIDAAALGVDAFMAQHRVGGLLILKDGEIALERYGLGLDETTRWYSYSLGKSVCSTLVGAAIHQGKIGGVEDPVTRYLPRMAGTAYDGNTLRNLLEMSSWVGWEEAYRNGSSDFGRYFNAVLEKRPGGAMAVMQSLHRAVPPGSKFVYSSGETYLIGAALAAATDRTLSDYLSERIWARFGMEADGYWTLDAEDGLEMASGGCNFVLRDYGRFGLFVLGGGAVGGERILPENWIAEASHPHADSPQVGYGRLTPGMPLGYGYQWWAFPSDNQSLTGHEGAFTGQGIFGQFLYIHPRERAVVVVWSAWPDPWVAESEWATYGFIARCFAALRR
jgi:CubicO group peptidase (beta-lactamase class C family)